MRRPAAPAEGEDPRRGLLQDEAASSPLTCASRRSAGRSRRRRSSPTPPTATTRPSAPICTRLELEYVVAVRAETSVYGPETTFAVPERTGTTGRPRTVARPDRKPESVRTLAVRLPAASVAHAALPNDAGGRARLEPLRVRPCRRHQPGPQPASAAALGVADHRMARGRGGAERLLALQPARRRAGRAARPARPPALDDRARLPPAQRRARARPLRRPQLPRLPPPHRARHLRTRLPHRGTPAPASPAAGLTLPQAVLLLQPVLRCWTGRCRTCQQPVDLDQLELLHRRE